MNPPTWLVLAAQLYGGYFVGGVVIVGAVFGWALWSSHRTERREAIARQQADHPHPSTRMLRPSRDVFDQERPNRYTVPTQRRTR